MTSNYIEQLDRALIRPGRIDIIADFKKCVNATLIEMMEFFFDIQLTGSEKMRILALEEYIVSPAEMGKIMFENFNDYANAIVELERISQITCTKQIELPQPPLDVNTETQPQPEIRPTPKYQNIININSREVPVNKNIPGFAQWNMDTYLPSSGSSFAQYV
jgi:hypothetical protein